MYARAIISLHGFETDTHLWLHVHIPPTLWNLQKMHSFVTKENRFLCSSVLVTFSNLNVRWRLEKTQFDNMAYFSKKKEIKETRLKIFSV